MITIIVVMKYTNHEVGVKRFFRFHNFVVSSGYLEKKYIGLYPTAGGQRATVLLSWIQAKSNTAKSASALSI